MDTDTIKWDIFKNYIEDKNNEINNEINKTIENNNLLTYEIPSDNLVIFLIKNNNYKQQNLYEITDDYIVRIEGHNINLNYNVKALNFIIPTDKLLTHNDKLLTAIENKLKYYNLTDIDLSNNLADLCDDYNKMIKYNNIDEFKTEFYNKINDIVNNQIKIKNVKLDEIIVINKKYVKDIFDFMATVRLDNFVLQKIEQLFENGIYKLEYKKKLIYFFFIIWNKYKIFY